MISFAKYGSGRRCDIIFSFDVLVLTLIYQLAISIVQSTKKNGRKTTFLSRVLDDDRSMTGSTLTNSQLAEECMGGMCVASMFIV